MHMQAHTHTQDTHTQHAHTHNTTQCNTMQHNATQHNTHAHSTHTHTLLLGITMWSIRHIKVCSLVLASPRSLQTPASKASMIKQPTSTAMPAFFGSFFPSTSLWHVYSETCIHQSQSAFHTLLCLVTSLQFCKACLIWQLKLSRIQFLIYILIVLVEQIISNLKFDWKVCVSGGGGGGTCERERETKRERQRE